MHAFPDCEDEAVAAGQILAVPIRDEKNLPHLVGLEDKPDRDENTKGQHEYREGPAVFQEFPEVGEERGRAGVHADFSRFT
jgi:hypothetical protein